MPHDHSHHHHHHIDPDAGDAKVAWAIAVNMILTLAQVIGGILSGSLALIADALHNFSDAISLIIAFVARKIARRPADSDMSFGYGRAEVVAALINYTTLVVIALYLGYEGVMRALDPQPIAGWMVVSIATIALVIDLVTAALTYRLSKESMNIRAAFLHNLADALGSVAVIIAGFAVIVLGWDWVDPVVTLMIAGYILWHVYAEIGGVIRVLMLGSPPGMQTEEVIEAILKTSGVEDIHHLHLWQMEESETALQAHVLIAESDLLKQTRIKQDIKQTLLDRFGISHTTLEFEYGDLICDNPKLIGH
ncbi:cation diffusion facilitator family transporter [Phaeobacter sp. 22II1-1F12B]|uniref:cation diffusion facilitator family transporter n=1 Tax=Phaeobacter sp. 22II1-1F12B TaxID=1317111 RepID=UPI000B5290C1|nr:cation diffusion facilitator family transporter [Phaeobacter sp. 22II1-1F12B]OWU82635.1 cation diffusion facilitator family transporter [Phaeobacter sp. 22II1-1F12B]